MRMERECGSIRDARLGQLGMGVRARGIEPRGSVQDRACGIEPRGHARPSHAGTRGTGQMRAWLGRLHRWVLSDGSLVITLGDE
jgi:hypothetical protein